MKGKHFGCCKSRDHRKYFKKFPDQCMQSKFFLFSNLGTQMNIFRNFQFNASNGLGGIVQTNCWPYLLIHYNYFYIPTSHGEKELKSISVLRLSNKMFYPFSKAIGSQSIWLKQQNQLSLNFQRKYQI